TCITARDIPGVNLLRVDGESMPLLAKNEASYVGEPVAILAGPSQRAVTEAMAAIEVEYEEAPPAFSLTHHEPSQVIARKRGERGDVAGALERSAHRVEGTYQTGIQEHLYNEPQGAVATFEAGRLIVRTATQWPFHVRTTIGEALGTPPSQCVVRPADPGIALDGKLWYPSLVSAHVALLADRTRKPVKLVYSNVEDFRFTSKRAPFYFHFTTGVTEEGALSGAEVEILYNAGAYGIFTDEICDRVVASTLAHYDCPDLRVSITVVRTNLPPLNVLSGFGSASAYFASETHATRVAEVAAIDPLTWRSENLTSAARPAASGRPGAKRRAPAGRAKTALVATGRVLETVAGVSDFGRRFAAYELQKKRRDEFGDLRRPTRGIGIAVGTSIGGFVGDHETRHGGSIVVRLETDGSAVLRTSAVRSSRVVAASWRNVVGEILGLDPSDVTIENSDTSTTPDSGPSTLSRNVVIVSRLVEQACNAIQKRRFRSPLPIEVRRSFRPGRASAFAVETLEGNAFVRAAYGAAVIEVSVDPVTFESTVENVWFAVDAGRILDETEARRSLEMSIYQALEWATHEIVVYRHGAVDARSYLAYRNISEPVLPRIHVELLDSSEKNPEGIGELPQSCIPAALASAVSQATGRYMDRLPTNPALIHDYMEPE
ncbi:MAG: xanthine dehydrogenase family protein molybdopterin-binding subunit, partial [Spirochaetota bacterium]